MRRIAPEHADAARAVAILPRPPPQSRPSEALSVVCAQVAPLVVGVLEQLFRDLNTLDPARIAQLTRTALASLADAAELVVHPVEHVQASAVVPAHVLLVDDSTLVPGGVYARGAHSDVDARVRTQLLWAVQECLRERDT